jgi:hydroxymethylbilane synthase
VGARSSPLSRAQFEEVRQEMRHIKMQPLWIETVGDKDRTTSLRTLEKTDFFTRELDEMLLRGEIDAAIHSAKDLPDPLPTGLVIAALTRGVDPRDSLVLREGESLRPKAVIATSSERREEAVKQLCPDAHFIDLRGTIGERLAKLQEGKADGVVVAEAALIRLGLTHLNRVILPHETVPLQGRLAIVVRKCDHKMRQLFAQIHVS